MAMCNAGECGAVATAPNGQCAVHAAGNRKHDGTRRVICAWCWKLIAKGEWYRDGRNGGLVRHAKPCEAPKR